MILAPNNAPDWVGDRSKLWNEVERIERRKDSQLAREIKLAIPVELDRTQQIELVKEFATEQFVSKGMVADVSFHDLNSHNPHAHIMLTMREIDENGFNPKKNRDWNKRELLEKQREAWAKTTNLALEKAGINETIDHRTLEAQGINRIPQIHLGSAVTAMMKRGIATDKGDRWLEIEETNKQIESLELSLAKVELDINTKKKLSLKTSKIRVSGISSSITLNFDTEEPDKSQAQNTRDEYNQTRSLIHQELGKDISESRLDLEIYLRSGSKSEIIKQSAVYQKFQKYEPKIAKCYLKAIASSAQTYNSLSKRKTPELDKWAKKIVDSQLSKFYAQENSQSQNIEKQQKRSRGLHL